MDKGQNQEPGRSESPTIDTTLRVLVAAANEVGLELGVTVFVGGAVITGDIIGNTKFHSELASFIRRDSGQRSEVIAGFFQGIVEDSEADKEESPDRDPKDLLEQVGYVHLKNVSYFAGSQLAALPGSLWRGRLESVDAYIFGRLNSR